jgi:hypothetical protein
MEGLAVSATAIAQRSQRMAGLAAIFGPVRAGIRQLGPAANGAHGDGRVSWFIGRGRRRGARHADSISRQRIRNDTGPHRSRKSNGLDDYK